MVKADDEELSLSWLDKAFLQDILSQDGNCSASVTDFDVSRAVAKGDNYASLLLRVLVHYRLDNEPTLKEKLLIVKSLPEGEMLQTFVVRIEAFTKEERVYKDVLPAMSRIMKGKSSCVGARMLACSRPDTIVLEDLSELGFRMADRHSQLDLPHALLVMKTLGQFHGASVVLHSADPSLMDSFGETVYTENTRDQMDMFMEPTFNILGGIVESWEGFEKYGEKVKQFGKIATDVAMKTVKPKEGSMCVLNHGDCWVNNCLFRYCEDTGKVVDMCFVDFQMARFSSPALDLLYFLYTSVQNEVRVRCLDELLDGYYTSLRDTVRVLGCEDKLMTLQELKDDIDDRREFGMMVAFSILSAVVADKEDALDLAGITEEDVKSGAVNPMEKAFRGKAFRNALQKLLPHFEECGTL